MPELSHAAWLLLCVAVFGVAFLYSSVGHGGATGYLAALALMGFAPASVRTAVLVTNVLVAGVAWWRFAREKHFDGRLLLAFAIGSVPCAVLGARLDVSMTGHKLILGPVLVFAGILLASRARQQGDDTPVRRIIWPVAMCAGGVLGLLAGITGIGGGVFLSPLLLVLGWAKPKTTGGVSAGFIVLNSIAGLVAAGQGKVVAAGNLLWLTVPAVMGALLGTYLGARRWNNVVFSRVLAGVLIVAGLKLLSELHR